MPFFGESEARAGRGRQDDLRLAGGVQSTEQGADGLDFTHRDRLDPEAPPGGRLWAGLGKKPNLWLKPAP